MLIDAYTAPNIKYITSSAENFSKEFEVYFSKVDCIIAASALHWFNQEKFFQECEKLLKKGGLIVIIGSSGKIYPNDEANIVLDGLFSDLKEFFPQNPISNSKNEFKDVKFPYNDLNKINFESKIKTKLIDVFNYFSTFSGVNKYFETYKNDELGIFKNYKNKIIKALNCKDENDEIEVNKNKYMIVNKK
jgi:SAM-dependent methyltransferase